MILHLLTILSIFMSLMLTILLIGGSYATKLDRDIRVGLTAAIVAYVLNITLLAAYLMLG